MKIDYHEKSNRFIIECKPDENSIVMGLPDRRFRKGSRTWSAPALRRNLEYMQGRMNNISMYTPEALKVYNEFQAKKNPTEQKEGFPSWFKFKKYEPMGHQKKTFEKAYPLDFFAMLFEQGLGKTYTSINLASAWRMTDQIDACVVVCPSSIKTVWGQELEELCPIDYQIHTLMAGKYKAAEKFIENKTDFQWLVVSLEALSQGKGHEYLARFLKTRRCCFILDESSRIKTPNKIRTDRCIKYGQEAKKRLILSGTSLTNGIQDLFTQYKFLDADIIGFSSYYTFRANFCRVIEIEIGVDPYGRPRTAPKIVGYKNEDELVDLITPYTVRAEKAECTDLPDKIYQDRYVSMNPTQRKMYQDMKDELFLEYGNDQEYEVASILEQTLRLQQITGGHHPFEDENQVKPVPIKGNNPKLEELANLMDEIHGKMVIWAQFRCEIELIAEKLRKMDIKFVEFHGGCDDLEKDFAVRSFRKDPDIKVFLATRAAAYGLTLVEASYAIYYSISYSLEEYEQSQDRIHRLGQKDKCTYIHLLCEGTIDKKIQTALSGKKNIATLIYDSIKEKQ